MLMGRKRREYSYDDWKKAMELHNKHKLGPTKISRILGINEDTVKNWLYKGVVPLAAKWKAMPSKELAYTVGVLHGDGCINKYKKRGGYEYVIQLEVTDKEFAIIFSKVMSRLLNRKYREPWWNEKRKVWRVVYQSKAFYEWYKRCEGQGLQGFKPYIEHDTETIKYYLKGLYDSEGNNNGNKEIRLGNTKKKLLEYIQYLLKEYFGIKTTGPYLQRKAGSIITINGIETRYKHGYYRIVIGRKQHIQKFLSEIGFTIIRKQLGLKKHEKVFVEGIGYLQPFKLVELGLFKLPFNQ